MADSVARSPQRPHGFTATVDTTVAHPAHLPGALLRREVRDERSPKSHGARPLLRRARGSALAGVYRRCRARLHAALAHRAAARGLATSHFLTTETSTALDILCGCSCGSWRARTTACGGRRRGARGGAAQQDRRRLRQAVIVCSLAAVGPRRSVIAALSDRRSHRRVVGARAAHGGSSARPAHRKSPATRPKAAEGGRAGSCRVSCLVARCGARWVAGSSACCGPTAGGVGRFGVATSRRARAAVGALPRPRRAYLRCWASAPLHRGQERARGAHSVLGMVAAITAAVSGTVGLPLEDQLGGSIVSWGLHRGRDGAVLPDTVRLRDAAAARHPRAHCDFAPDRGRGGVIIVGPAKACRRLQRQRFAEWARAAHRALRRGSSAKAPSSPDRAGLRLAVSGGATELLESSSKPVYFACPIACRGGDVDGSSTATDRLTRPCREPRGRRGRPPSRARVVAQATSTSGKCSAQCSRSARAPTRAPRRGDAKARQQLALALDRRARDHPANGQALEQQLAARAAAASSRVLAGTPAAARERAARTRRARPR